MKRIINSLALLLLPPLVLVGARPLWAQATSTTAVVQTTAVTNAPAWRPANDLLANASWEYRHRSTEAWSNQPPEFMRLAALPPRLLLVPEAMRGT